MEEDTVTFGGYDEDDEEGCGCGGGGGGGCVW